MTKRIAGSDEETRFWLKVKSSYDGCWTWAGSRSVKQYGRMFINKTSVPSHRYSWVLHNGEIPHGLLVCHHCDNPPCVRPSHLFLGTTQENALDALAKGRLKLDCWKKAVLFGEENPAAKLRAGDIGTIRKLYSDGVIMRLIAERYGVNQATIWRVVRGETWAGVR